MQQKRNYAYPIENSPAIHQALRCSSVRKQPTNQSKRILYFVFTPTTCTIPVGSLQGTFSKLDGKSTASYAATSKLNLN